MRRRFRLLKLTAVFVVTSAASGMTMDVEKGLRAFRMRLGDWLKVKASLRGIKSRLERARRRSRVTAVMLGCWDNCLRDSASSSDSFKEDLFFELFVKNW